jgi:hypothetical protein
VLQLLQQRTTRHRQLLYRSVEAARQHNLLLLLLTRPICSCKLCLLLLLQLLGKAFTLHHTC